MIDTNYNDKIDAITGHLPLLQVVMDYEHYPCSKCDKLMTFMHNPHLGPPYWKCHYCGHVQSWDHENEPEYYKS